MKERAITFAADVLDRAGVLRLLLAARKRRLWPDGGLTVLVYHRVANPGEIGELDPDLIDATPAEFDAQMAYLRANFHPIGLEELLAAQRGEAPLPAGSALVTFDDGYRDNCEQAFPILKRHGMRAIFFVTTGHVSERRLFWWERIALLVRRSRGQRIELAFPVRRQLDISTPEAKKRTVWHLNRIVKDAFALDVDRFLDELAVACDVRFTPEEERALADGALMTWDDVRTMRREGMGIGSHTRDHRVLQTLPAEHLARELRDSRAQLERELGEPITTIAYPVGKSIQSLPAVRQAVADAGYELGFTTEPGTNVLPSSDQRLNLKRLSIDRGVPAGLARVRLAMPTLVR